MFEIYIAFILGESFSRMMGYSKTLKRNMSDDEVGWRCVETIRGGFGVLYLARSATYRADAQQTIKGNKITVFICVSEILLCLIKEKSTRPV